MTAALVPSIVRPGRRRKPTLEERAARMDAAGRRRVEARRAEAARRRTETARRFDRRRWWKRRAPAVLAEARRRYHAEVDRLPPALRAAYEMASPEVRRLIREQNEDDLRLVVKWNPGLPSGLTGERRIG